MRLSRLAMSVGGVLGLSLAALVAVSSAASEARRAATITIATVNNPDMVVMQSLNKWIENLGPYFKKLSPAASKAYDLNDVIPKRVHEVGDPSPSSGTRADAVSSLVPPRR